MKRPFIKFFDKIIVVLLGLSGFFSSCDKDDPWKDNPRVAYGMPYAKFEIKGTVTERLTSNPIQNIRVIIRPSHWAGGDTLYTDAAGKYAFNTVNSPDAFQYHLTVEDIDGQENGGEFATQEKDVTFTNADKVENGSGWSHGKYAKTQNVELNKIGMAIPMYGVLPSTFKP